MFHRSRLIQLSIGMTILWIVVLAGGVALTGKGLRDANASYKDFRLRIGAIEEKRDQFDQAYQRYQSRSGNIERLQGAFLNEKNVLAVVSLLEQEARRAGVGYAVEGVSEDTQAAEKTSKGTAANILPGTIFDLELSGSVTQIWEFVRSVQAFPYFLQIRRLAITAAAAPVEGSPLKGTVILKIYHLPTGQ